MFPRSVRRFDDDGFASRGFVKGYVGPQGFGDEVRVLADHSLRAGRDWITGANEPGRHVRGANVGRDFRVDAYEDLVQMRDGDRCPVDGGTLHVARSIVVGHIYQLGTHYSAPLGASFAGEDGSDKPYVMGSYGIGISRIMAAAVEQNHDDVGIVWPKVMAPFDVVVIQAVQGDGSVTRYAQRLYEELTTHGVAVALDDRQERAGVKFADADLVGYPVQVTAGPKGIQSGSVDLKLRATGARSAAPLDDAVRTTLELLASAP
jgi:prolyl-tRNA synthetase